MNKLLLLEQSVARALDINPDVVELRVAASIISHFRSSETDGAKAQALADELYPVLVPLLPATGPAAVVTQLLGIAEPYVGKLVDWTELKFAKQIDGVDLQNGPAEPLPT